MKITRETITGMLKNTKSRDFSVASFFYCWKLDTSRRGHFFSTALT